MMPSPTSEATRTSMRFLITSKWPRAAAVLLCVLDSAAQAQSASCNRARAIADEARAAYEAGNPDHRALLEKLRTAHQLCPTLGDAWKYAFCSALAVNDPQKARMFRDRAVFN